MPEIVLEQNIISTYLSLPLCTFSIAEIQRLRMYIDIFYLKSSLTLTTHLNTEILQFGARVAEVTVDTRMLQNDMCFTGAKIMTG